MDEQFKTLILLFDYLKEGKDNITSTDGITVIEAPSQSYLMIELIRKLRPQVVVTWNAQFEAVTSFAFKHLLRVTREIGSRLFIDISYQFELSSLPNSIEVLKYLAQTLLPSHAAIICGLLRNQIKQNASNGRLVKRCTSWSWEHVHGLKDHVLVKRTVGNKMHKAFPLPDDTTTKRDAEQSGRTVTLTIEDMQKKKNDVKARTTLLLSLPDEHQLRFSKYKTAKELWAAILKTFGGNEAAKKRKKNLLKQQYGNFKAEGTKTLEQTFIRF
uniref:Methionine S-methyltransferase n=1 Tax=Tanacetum cinerariifolium TaxID=118510 RepID=A0A699HPN1_TANCI|nr:methionine S-methyltransferase [Tanacetum cinerariifolium]